MIAFVMSGGANRGALEAGALLALFEAGIKPDILVGTSAGSINASYIATNPTIEGARQLVEMWKQARREDFFPGRWYNMVWRLVRGRSLFSSDPFRDSIERRLPINKRRFGDLQGVKLYITAANLTTGTLYLYGEDPDASIVDAVMASTAHPLAYPPVRFGNYQLVDGGVIANVPTGIAVDKGATEIYILNVGYGGEVVSNRGSVFGVLGQSISMMMYQHFVMDLKYILENTDATLHHIMLSGFKDSAMWDFAHAAEMATAGHTAAQEYLKSPLGLASLPMASLGESQNDAAPEGARVYVPACFSPMDLLSLPDSECEVSTYLSRHGTSDPFKLAHALGRTPGSVRRDLASLIKKGRVQCFPDGTVRLVFGRSHHRNVPNQVWTTLATDEEASCIEE